MKNNYLMLLVSLFSLLLVSCGDDDGDNIDEQKPEIDVAYSNAFPSSCDDVIYFGETVTINARLLDNVELGSYSIDIHNNFDHHSHSTVFTECDLEAKKTPNNPFVFIEQYPIPSGTSEYITDLQINIPTSNANGQFDEGDYHFDISVTDKEGWSKNFGIGIKMMYR